MVAIVMPVVTILKAPISVSANQDFTETDETAAKVSHYYLVGKFKAGRRCGESAGLSPL